LTKHWRYLRYILRHKWFVFQYGRQLSIPWLALLHDNSKFLPDEWFPYCDFFYGNGHDRERKRDAFRVAWLLHQNRNRHHWQFWMLVNDEEPPRLLPMPDRYRREMLADWKGAGRAITGIEDAHGWYAKNREKMHLHAETREWIEQQLGYPRRLDRDKNY
jgi:Family of unknown function (DUF5662)